MAVLAGAAAVGLGVVVWRTTPPVPTFTLTLHAVPSGPLAVPAPATTIRVLLPVYPRAAAISPRVPGSMDGMPGADDLRIGRRAVFVPLSRTRAEIWYARAMSALGYKRQGFGWSGDRSGLITWMVQYVPQGQDADALTVSINFHPEHGGTAVQYFATAIVTPLRPVWLPRLEHVNSVHIDGALVSGRHGITTVTDRAALSRLAGWLNALTPVSTAASLCPKETDNLTMLLRASPNQTAQGMVTSCDPAVWLNGVELADPRYAVLRAGLEALGDPVPRWLQALAALPAARMP